MGKGSFSVAVEFQFMMFLKTMTVHLCDSLLFPTRGSVFRFCQSPLSLSLSSEGERDSGHWTLTV